MWEVDPGDNVLGGKHRDAENTERQTTAGLSVFLTPKNLEEIGFHGKQKPQVLTELRKKYIVLQVLENDF